MSADAETISIEILIRGHCHEYFPHIPESFTHTCLGGNELRQIMEGLGIKPQLIMGVVVNGKLKSKNYIPVQGDRIILLSPPTGG